MTLYYTSFNNIGSCEGLASPSDNGQLIGQLATGEATPTAVAAPYNLPPMTATLSLHGNAAAHTGVHLQPLTAGPTPHPQYHRPAKHDRLRVETDYISHVQRRRGDPAETVDSCIICVAITGWTWHRNIASHHISNHHAPLIVPPRPVPQSASTHSPHRKPSCSIPPHQRSRLSVHWNVLRIE
ncbi:hypothetical protein LZ30DRAFT_800378 [Colletotrichum cereale]|nr:hypothetical protein LZ30DRAFT_800378 [Colletotrichum cereale]